MVGVALALGGFVSLYMTSYVSSTSRVVGISITDAALIKLNDHIYLSITVRNTGSVPCQLYNITVHTSNKVYYVTQPFNINLSPGGTITVTEADLLTHGCVLNPNDFELGSSYLVRVYVKSGEELVSYSITVVCQG